MNTQHAERVAEITALVEGYSFKQSEGLVVWFNRQARPTSDLLGRFTHLDAISACRNAASTAGAALQLGAENHPNVVAVIREWDDTTLSARRFLLARFVGQLLSWSGPDAE